MKKKIIVAIDGHSSCGKSTMAKDLAREVGYIYVDTGAMYRTVTLYALRHGMFQSDGTVNEEALREADLVMVTAAHTNVDYAFVQKNAKFVFDTKNAMKAVTERGNIEIL